MFLHHINPATLHCAARGSLARFSLPAVYASACPGSDLRHPSARYLACPAFRRALSLPLARPRPPIHLLSDRPDRRPHTETLGAQTSLVSRSLARAAPVAEAQSLPLERQRRSARIALRERSTAQLLRATCSITAHSLRRHDLRASAQTPWAHRRPSVGRADAVTSQAFFIFNQKGEVLISRLFRSDLKCVAPLGVLRAPALTCRFRPGAPSRTSFASRSCRTRTSVRPSSPSAAPASSMYATRTSMWSP